MIEPKLDLEGDKGRGSVELMYRTKSYQWAGDPDMSKKGSKWVSE